MTRRGWLWWALLAIGAMTLLSGAVQAAAPGFILRPLGSEITPASLHFFGIVGMFMVLFGGMLVHALVSEEAQPVALLWAALQKFGASAAVGLGVANGVFSSLATVVALFDLLSGVLAIAYWRSVKDVR